MDLGLLVVILPFAVLAGALWLAATRVMAPGWLRAWTLLFAGIITLLLVGGFLSLAIPLVTRARG